MNSAWGVFATVAVAHALAVSSPGPDFAIVVRQTLGFGRRAGLLTAWGIASGILLHVAWAMFGLGWVVHQWPLLLELLRIGGACFLLWIGVQALRARPATGANDASAAPSPAPSSSRHFWIGWTTNVLNPKALLFFGALFSAVVTTVNAGWLRPALALWLILATGAWFSLVALAVGHPRLRSSLREHAHRIDHAMGAILIGLGAWMLLGPLVAGLI